MTIQVIAMLCAGEDVRQWEVSFIASRQVQPHDHFSKQFDNFKKKKTKIKQTLNI